MLEIIFVTCFCGLLLLATVFRLTKRQQAGPFGKHLPGPAGWPLVGNLLQLDKNYPHFTLEKWAKQYGPVFSVKMCTATWVIVSGYEELQEMLVSNGRAFAGRYSQFIHKSIILAGKDLAFSDSTAPQYNSLKRAMHRTLHQTNDSPGMAETVLSRAIGEFIEKLASYDGREIDIKDDIDNFVMKITIAMIAGQIPADEDPDLHDMKRLNRLVLDVISTGRGIELDYFPWLRHLGHPLYSEILRISELRDDLWQRLWNRSKQYDATNDAPFSLMYTITQIMDMKSVHYDPLVDMDNAKGMFLNFIVGSFITTSSFAYAFVNILLHHNDIYKRIQDEVELVTGGNRLPSITDQSEMPFTMAAIHELIRFANLTVTFPHKTLRDVTLHGFHIPRNTIVLPLFWTLHRDESFWDEPWIFDPNRFIDEEGKLLSVDHPKRKRVIGFGAGIRACIGEKFALKRLFMFTTNLAFKFDLRYATEITPCDPRLYTNGTVLQERPFKIKLISRNT